MSILEVNSTINKYKILKNLGSHSLGETYLAQKAIYDQMLQKSILKIFLIKTFNLSKLRELGISADFFEAEIKALEELSTKPLADQYISCYYDHFMATRGEPYMLLVTDYVQGSTLQQILLEEKKIMTTSRLLQAMSEIAQCVDYIHNYGVAHQNIKPSNIVYDNGSKRYRLVDFAFSCAQQLNAQCKGRAMSAYYTPPEVLASKTESEDFGLRKAHDIWSTGVTFYQMANLGRDYMDFTNNDPTLIAKEIQIGEVKPSQFPYAPVNKLIDSMLNKKPKERPTAGQVLILIRLARPLCIVDGKSYDRETAEALATSFGLDINPNIDDYSLCSIVTNHLSVCKINEHEYQLEQLIELSKILGIEVYANIEGKQLCSVIQDSIQGHRQEYKNHVTGELLRALEYMTFIQVRSLAEPKLKPVLERLEKQYLRVYEEAQKLGLLNLQMLKNKRAVIEQKSSVYAQNASAVFAKIYKLLAERIGEVLLAES